MVKLASIDNDADWVLDRDFLANTVLPGLDATEVEVAFDPALVAVNRNRRDVGTYKKTLRFCIMVKQQPGRHLMAMVKENNIPLKKLGKDGPWILDPNKRVTLLKQLKEFYASRYKVPAPPSSRLEIIFPY
ncbi:MAG: hypothetical protein IT541_15665 [Hyphomicrobiales bacterium]|nr:hypothetical protein [Hyphomicrobiales bacterium]